MYGYIYKTTNLINSKIYIGQHKSKTFDSKYYGSGKYLKNAINKYGKENFSVDVVEWCESREIADDREVYYIKKFNSRDVKVGYNIAYGGEGGDLVSCLSESDYKKFSKTMSEYNRAGIIGNKGKHLSEEHRRKISEGNKGKKRSKDVIEAHRLKVKGLPAWNKGLTIDDPRVAKYARKKGEYHHSDATRLKISNSMKHRENMGKYVKSEAHKQKLRDVIKGKIWVNNGCKSKMIRPDDLEKYLEFGYVRGRGKIK